MEHTLQDLTDLVLSALPTALLVGLLAVLLNLILFRPLAATLAQREAATKGTIEQARLAIQQAEEKVAEYERLLRSARSEILREQEAERQVLRREQAKLLATARERTQAQVEEAKRQIRSEAEAARESLLEQAESLAAVVAEAAARGVRL